MKTFLIVVLFTLVGELCGDAAPDDAQVETAVRATRSHYQEINAHAANYRQIKKELSGFSTEGGALVAFFDGDALVKMVATFYGESGEATEEYYYWEGKLIFVFRADSDYDGLRSGKIVRTAEDRFYFRDGVLIRWVDPHAEPVVPSSGSFLEKQRECLQNAATFEREAR